MPTAETDWPTFLAALGAFITVAGGVLVLIIKQIQQGHVMAKVATDIPKVHTLVNKNFTEQKATIDRQSAEIAALRIQYEKALATMQAAANAVASERLRDAKAAPAEVEGEAHP